MLSSQTKAMRRPSGEMVGSAGMFRNRPFPGVISNRMRPDAAAGRRMEFVAPHMTAAPIPNATRSRAQTGRTDRFFATTGAGTEPELPGMTPLINDTPPLPDSSRSSCIKSRALCHRSSGSFVRQRSTRRTNPGGHSGTSVRTGVGVRSRIAAMSPAWLGAWKGRRPVNIS